jgi:hypothetical protein
VGAGILLLATGVTVGGPASAYAAASLFITLGLEVAPNAVLYAYADDDEERARYLYSIMAAISMEAIGTAASEFVPALVKAAALTFARGAATSARSRLPQLFEFGSEQLGTLANRLRIERLRAKPRASTH